MIKTTDRASANISQLTRNSTIFILLIHVADMNLGHRYMVLTKVEGIDGKTKTKENKCFGRVT